MVYAGTVILFLYLPLLFATSILFFISFIHGNRKGDVGYSIKRRSIVFLLATSSVPFGIYSITLLPETLGLSTNSAIIVRLLIGLALIFSGFIIRYQSIKYFFWGLGLFCVIIQIMTYINAGPDMFLYLFGVGLILIIIFFKKKGLL